MKTLSQVLGSRRTAVVSVGPRESAHHALKLMTDHGVGAVVVLQQGGIVGVVGEHECRAHLDAAGPRSAELRVQEIMTPVVCASHQTTVREAMAMMAARQVSHLPVLDDYKDVVGLISMRALSQETAAA